MARMMDALKQAEAHRAVAIATPAPELPPAQLAQEGEAGEGMLFIEVGGKGQPLSASPEVLACAPVRKQSVAPSLVPVAPAGPGLFTVDLQPLPPQRQPSRYFAPELLTYHQPDHPVSKQYKGLLDRLLGNAGGCQVLLLTAASSGVGTTTVLLNLAIAACTPGRRVAVMDLNLARPAVALRLGLPATPGLREILAGTAAPEQALQATAVAGLHALGTTPGAGPSPALTAEALRWLTCWLRERFDVVFVDGPPWDESLELASLAVLADAIYPVLTEAEMSSPTMRQMLLAIARRGGCLRGLLHAQKAA
jgi:Mrp family chromosome partitioning ATPase